MFLITLVGIKLVFDQEINDMLYWTVLYYILLHT